MRTKTALCLLRHHTKRIMTTDMLVIKAIKANKSAKGSSLATIRKYILENHGADGTIKAASIKASVKRVMDRGKIVLTSGKGLRGSFKQASTKRAVKHPKILKRPDKANAKSKTKYPSMRVMITTALRNTKFTTESVYGMKKFIARKYNVDFTVMKCDDLKSCLLQMISEGKVMRTCGRGVNGSFKLAANTKAKTAVDLVTAPKSQHPSMSDMIIAALEAKGSCIGMSLYSIKQYIASVYLLDVRKLSDSVRNSLRKLIDTNQVLGMNGAGLSGYFKLSRHVSAKERKECAQSYLKCNSSTNKAQPSLRQAITRALEINTDPGGSSLHIIKKYIAAILDVNISTVRSTSIKTCLQKLVKSGKVTQAKGKGMSGSFKLAASAQNRAKSSSTPHIARVAKMKVETSYRL